MEVTRVSWNDERLDDLNVRVEAMHDDMRTEFRAMRAEMQAELHALQRSVIALMGTMLVVLASVLGVTAF